MTALSFGLEPQVVAGRAQDRDVTLARQVAIYVARQHLKLSSTDIDRAFGRDHSTVLHACEKIEEELSRDMRLKALVESLKRNCDMSERIAAMGSIDVLKVARAVAANPARRAISASVMEIAALAATVIDLWEIARAAEAMIHARRRNLEISCELPMTAALAAEEEETAALAEALEASILDELAALRGDENPDPTKENDDERSH